MARHSHLTGKVHPVSPYSDRNPFASGTDGTPAVVEAPTPSTANLVAEVGAALSRAQGALHELLSRADSLDDLVEAAGVAKSAHGDLYDTFGHVKAALWERVGSGKHATETGRTFSFTAPAPRRSTDLKALKSDYPDVYDAVVTERPCKADAVGALRLPTAKRGA